MGLFGRSFFFPQFQWSVIIFPLLTVQFIATQALGTGDGSKPTRPYILRHLQPILESETAEKICGHLTYIWKMDEHGPCIYDLPDGRFP